MSAKAASQALDRAFDRRIEDSFLFLADSYGGSALAREAGEEDFRKRYFEAKEALAFAKDVAEGDRP